METKDYKKLYEAIVDMSEDLDGVGEIREISEEDIEKAKWIACILDCITFLPRYRMKFIFNQKDIVFNRDDFLYEYFY